MYRIPPLLSPNVKQFDTDEVGAGADQGQEEEDRTKEDIQSPVIVVLFVAAVANPTAEISVRTRNSLDFTKHRI